MLPTSFGSSINTTEPIKLSINTEASEVFTPNARLITEFAITNEIAQPNFPMGANNPAINPPKAKPPQTNPCVLLAMLKIAPVETPLTVPPFTPPYLAHKSTIITAIILPRDMFS